MGAETHTSQMQKFLKYPKLETIIYKCKTSEVKNRERKEKKMCRQNLWDKGKNNKNTKQNKPSKMTIEIIL